MMDKIKSIVEDHLYYTLALAGICVLAFDLGLVIGWIWVKLL